MSATLQWLAALTVLSACQPPYPPELRGGAVNPICVLICDAKFTNSDADPGATLNSTQSNSQTGGSKSGGATVTDPNG